MKTYALILITLLASLASSIEVKAQERVRRNLVLEWESVEGATLYEVQIIRKDDRAKKPQRFQTKKPEWSAVVKPGPYTFQLRSYDDRGVPGDWSPPADMQVKLPAIIGTSPAADARVDANDQDRERVTLKWEPVPGAEKYAVQIKSQSADFEKTDEVSGTEWEGSVPVGHPYTWSVTAIDPNGERGDELSEPYKFEMFGPPIEKPKIEKPLSTYVKEMRWAAPKHAKSYSLELKYFNRKNKTWETIETKGDHPTNSLDLDISRPSGRYRLQVQANGPHRQPSASQSLEFNMKGGFKSAEDWDAAALRDGVVKPTNFYAIASYLISQVDYSGGNRDANSSPSFSALGGTGRLGAGYQERGSDWGGFAIVDLSGFIIEGQNFRFASAEFHITRKLELGQKGLLLLASGLFSKELPIVLGAVNEGYTGVGKVRGNGPHAGFIYWTPLKGKFGLQANARAYYTLFGSSSNGQKAESALSYQYGLLGSYRLNRNWMGFAGYAYRRDEAIYATNPGDPESFAQPGQTNTISIEGHYLNLILEWSF